MASLFIEGQDGKPINVSLLQTLYIDPLDDKIVKFIFINGESISEEYSSAELAQSRLDGIKENLCSNGGGTVNLEIKEITINENGETTVTYGSGYDGLGSVEITTNVPQPSGTINITEEGIIDVTNYKNANVNIQTIKVPDGMKLGKSTVEILNNLDTSNVTDMSNFFNQCTNLVTVDNLDTSNVTTMVSMFANCPKIKNVPVMNASKVTDMKDMFKWSGSPSNDSLNNILSTCASTTEAYTGTKTLKYISLSSSQATTCQTLSNWQDFVDAGWTTGY